MISTILLIAVVAILLVVAVRSFEDSMIYFPAKYPEGYWSPVDFGVQAEDCYFESEDGIRLHGWYAPSPGVRPTTLWAHGNAGNITHRLDHIKLLVEQVGLNVFIFDYRGYGRSDGKPSEEGLYRDARAAYDYLIKQRMLLPSDVIIYGQSLGGAVAVDLATTRSCSGLVLEATFTSARDMARLVIPLLPVDWVIKSEFNGLAKIARVRIPILMLHGAHDRTVPIRLGRTLFESANEPKRFVELPHSDHNDGYVVDSQLYVDSLREFLSGMK